MLDDKAILPKLRMNRSEPSQFRLDSWSIPRTAQPRKNQSNVQLPHATGDCSALTGP